MKKRIRNVVYSFSLLSSLFMSPTVEAQIPANAFKKVTKYFRKDKQYMSPVLGKVALEGFIHDLRFYGDYESGMDNDRRAYIKDNSNDPLWNVLKVLFP